jgi:hypothetical protein
LVRRAAICVLLVVVAAAPEVASAASIAAVPVLPPSLQDQLLGANTGGKFVCSATPAADGTAVYFSLALPASSSGPDVSGLYRRDLATGVTAELLPLPNQAECGTFSNDGALFAYNSATSDLVLIDLVSGTRLQLCSLCAGGGPLRFSDNGRYLFFSPVDGRLIRYDHQTGVQQPVTDATGAPLHAFALDYSISGDGQRIAFATGTAGVVSQPATQPNFMYAYVSDFATGDNQLISLEASAPVFGDRPLISADGTRVAYFRFSSTGLGQAALVTLRSGEQQLISVTRQLVQGNGFSAPIAISANGNAVLFESTATDLVAGVTIQLPTAPTFSDHGPLYYRDVAGGETVLVTRSVNGARNSTDGGGEAVFDRAGDTVVFISHADDLVVGGPPNPMDQVYTFSMSDRSTTLLTTDWPTPQLAASPRISGQGGAIVFDLAIDALGVAILPYVAIAPTVTPPQQCPTRETRKRRGESHRRCSCVPVQSATSRHSDDRGERCSDCDTSVGRDDGYRKGSAPRTAGHSQESMIRCPPGVSNPEPTD